MPVEKVPEIVVSRLPVYLRALTEMKTANREITSSQELGDRLGFSSAQIRKDLSQFGEFGKQGTGYHISFLIEQLQRILKVDRVWDTALVGAGDLGHAVANYGGFVHRGFRIVGVFDNDQDKIGEKAGPFVIQGVSGLDSFIRERGIKIAMLTVPAAAAQDLATRLVEAGVSAILCYAPTSINVPESVRVEYIDPSLHLQNMAYYLAD
jgi:redox-sensing transcriptional repressor